MMNNHTSHSKKKATILFSSAVFLFIISGCQSMTPIRTVDKVDLDRFMGDWYVIAGIPDKSLISALT